MRNLKTLLPYSFFVISIIYTIIITSQTIYHTKYNINDTDIKGIIINQKIDGNKLSLEIKSAEKVSVTYYIKNEEELRIIEQYKLGDTLLIKGTLEEPSTNSNFNLFNYKNYLLSKKTYWLMKATSIIKTKANTNLFYKFKNIVMFKIKDYKSESYLKAFVLGDSTMIESDILSSYRTNGISHLLAVSGAQVTLLSVVLLFILNKIKKRKSNYFFIVLCLLLYLFLTGFSPSILRATLFFIALTVKKEFGVPISTVQAFLIILSLLLLVNPYYIYHLGFLLSFIISFYLIIFNKYISKEKNYIKQVLITSIISFTGSIPILINNSFEINFFSIILNIIFVPLVSFVIFPFSLITFFFPFLDNIFLFLTNLLEQMSVISSNIKVFTLIVPKVSFPVYLLYFGLVTFVLYKWEKRYFLILLCILLIHSNIRIINKYPIITMLDVGQGDSILIELPYASSTILIDTGGILAYDVEDWAKKKNDYSIASNITIPYVKSIGVKKIDYLILTHGDVDHMGEAINLINNFRVGNVIFNCGEYNDLENELIKVLKEKNIKYNSCIKELNIDKYTLQFLNNKIYDNENDNSIVIYTKLSDYKFLLMGDAGKIVEKDILNKYNIHDIDFLKVGHHGSYTSSSEFFISNIKPKYSLISVGLNNRFGHPKESVLDVLKNSNIYRTDNDGSIEIKLNKNGYNIKTCRHRKE